jgi:hypothetical protein
VIEVRIEDGDFGDLIDQEPVELGRLMNEAFHPVPPPWVPNKERGDVVSPKAG